MVSVAIMRTSVCVDGACNYSARAEKNKKPATTKLCVTHLLQFTAKERSSREKKSGVKLRL